MKQKHLQVFGTVQGVGFRYYTQRLANKYNILGTVQNVDDYVEIYAMVMTMTSNSLLML